MDTEHVVRPIFPRWTNAIPTVAAVGGFFALVAVTAGVTYYFTPQFWRVGYQPDQPVNYSHQLHAGTLGIDCRYCHTDVEKSPHSNIPDTSTCMNCHTGSGDQSYLNLTLWNAHKVNVNLVQVREAYATTKPIEWKRIHKVPDYAHFNHAAHIKAGVSCVSCHGRIDEQAVVRQVQGMAMGWCLDCHRNPDRAVVAADDLSSTPEPKITDLAAIEALLASPSQRQTGTELVKTKQIEPPEYCAACHY